MSHEAVRSSVQRILAWDLGLETEVSEKGLLRITSVRLQLTGGIKPRRLNRKYVDCLQFEVFPCLQEQCSAGSRQQVAGGIKRPGTWEEPGSVKDCLSCVRLYRSLLDEVAC